MAVVASLAFGCAEQPGKKKDDDKKADKKGEAKDGKDGKTTESKVAPAKTPE